MRLEKRRVGALNCQLITAEQPELLLVLCHGFGAPGDDLVPIGGYLLQSQPEWADRVAILFPEAPLSLAEMGMPGGRAWWPIDMLKLSQMMQLGEFRDLRSEAPERLPLCRDLLTESISALQSELNLPMSQTVVGGFSQGAMLATDWTLHAAEPPGGLVVWSGTLLNEVDWRARSQNLSGLPIVQSHGTEDQILPYQAAECLQELFTSAGAEVNFVPFRGGHTIPPPAIAAAVSLLNTLL